MDISDIIFSSTAPTSLKLALVELIEAESITYDMRVLSPTSSNDDINGSQHAANGGTDFTYEDAREDQFHSASSLGFYEYFAETFGGYTGHYYHGSDQKFAAVVIDPPAYAASVTF